LDGRRSYDAYKKRELLKKVAPVSGGREVERKV